MNEKEVDELLKKAAYGDDYAFTVFVQLTEPELYDYCHKKFEGKCDNDAEDIVNEAYHKLSINLKELRETSSAVNWLKTTIYRSGIDLIRQKNRHPLISIYGNEDNDITTYIKDESSDYAPFEHAFRSEQCAEMADAMAKVPTLYRDVLTCRFCLDMSVKETAKKLGRTEGTIKRQTHYAVKALRSEYTKRAHRQNGDVPSLHLSDYRSCYHARYSSVGNPEKCASVKLLSFESLNIS